MGDVSRALDAVVGRAYAGVFAISPRRSLGDERVFVAARAVCSAVPVMLLDTAGAAGTAGVEESE